MFLITKVHLHAHELWLQVYGMKTQRTVTHNGDKQTYRQ